jgi:CheY-like chemotaxis protein
MEHATISKSAAVIALVVFLGLGVIEPIWHAEAAAPARPLNQADPQAPSQVTPPEPAALVRSYETSLANELREFEAQMGIRNWFRRLLRAKTEGGIPSPDVGRDLFDSSGPDFLRPEERPRHTLLIVDDEMDTLNTIRHQFRNTYFVLTACSAAAAVELLTQNDVHVIISDQRMPGMSGDVFLRHARRIRPNAIRILIQHYRPEVSPELAAILNRLLAKDPADRFESAADVVTALGPFRAGADLSKLLPSPGLSTTVDWRIASS